MNNELTRCPECNTALASIEQAHAIDGQLFCSKACFIEYQTKSYIMNARALAHEDYACGAEIVPTAEIIKDEMYELVDKENSSCEEAD